jgi:DNA polymerase III sliding clamp (beta) subunit (PCNA family)
MYNLHQAIQAIKTVSESVTINSDGIIYGGNVSVATTPFNKDVEWCLELPTTILNTVLNKLKKFSLSFDYDPDNLLVINYDYGQFNVKGWEPESKFNNTSEGKLIYSFILTDSLCQIIIDASQFCTTKDARQDFNGVAIMPKDDKITVFATNGIMLYYKSVEQDFYANSDVSFRIYTPLVDLIKKFMPIGATINVYDDSLNIVKNDLTLTQPFEYGRTNAKRLYDSTTQLMSSFIGDSIILADSKELVKMAKMCNKYDDYIKFCWQGNRLTINSKNHTFKPDIACAGADFTLILSPQILLNAIGNSQQTMIKFSDGQINCAVNGLLVGLVKIKTD